LKSKRRNSCASRCACAARPVFCPARFPFTRWCAAPSSAACFPPAGQFITEFQKIRQRLCQLVSARNVQILLGSGTLANDTVGAQLSLEKEPGLILSNGEFGERLIDQARRFGLTFDTLKFRWGEPFNLAAVEQFLSRSSAVGWLWCVHSETSTGMLNPLSTLQALCAKSRVKLCADCISSIGLVPVNLEGIYLASCASGKGLAGYPGLCMVFHNHPLSSSTALPRYLDLGWYDEHQGIAFTHSSNLVQALDAAVRQPDWPAKMAAVAAVFRQAPPPLARIWLQSDRAGFRGDAGSDHDRAAAEPQFD
jgi:aspartate aminotransferase-like enzyme